MEKIEFIEGTVKELIEGAGGTVTEIVGPLPDGSGYATASFPLPKDHWIYKETGEPPVPFLMGTDNPDREEWCRKIWEAGKYAVKGATLNGEEMDFDPDALIQNLVVGMLGYHTPDGKSTLEGG